MNMSLLKQISLCYNFPPVIQLSCEIFLTGVRIVFIMLSLLETEAPILFVVILSITHVHSQNALPWSKKCGKAFQINQTNHAFFSQNFEFAEETLCKWELIGNTGCEVEVACSISLPSKPDGKCSSAHLLVTDGHGGAKKFCGKYSFEFVRPSEGLRDLFLVLHTKHNHADKYDGINCMAKCVNLLDNSDNSRRLPKTLKNKIDRSCGCGIKNDEQRIVGGEDAKFNEFPWLAAIVFKGTRQPFCGGALINDRFVLTAAHCLGFTGETKAEDMDVLLHAHVLDKSTHDKDGKEIKGSGDDLALKTDEDEKTLRFTIKEIISHPFFSREMDYDYALFLLDKPIKLAQEDAPTPICLPPVTTFDSFGMDGKNLTVSGWGMPGPKAKHSTRLLQKLVVPHISKEKCEEYLEDAYTDRMICFGHEHHEKDVCKGDSGGPLVLQLPSKQWWQLGIVSFGIGCGLGNPTGVVVYSKVTCGHLFLNSQNEKKLGLYLLEPNYNEFKFPDAVQWIHFHTAHHEAKWCSEQESTGRIG